MNKRIGSLRERGVITGKDSDRKLLFPYFRKNSLWEFLAETLKVESIKRLIFPKIFQKRGY